jgi:hypothetical protein
MDVIKNQCSHVTGQNLPFSDTNIIAFEYAHIKKKKQVATNLRLKRGCLGARRNV